MKPFQDRNPVAVGAVSITVLVLAVLAAFQLDTLAGLFDARYRAAFDDASGLRPNDEVRIAGVKVGKVTGIRLAGFRQDAGEQHPYVRVDFRITSEVRLGNRTSALIAIKTLVGQKYLALEPAGPGRMAHGDLIPRSRTASPFDVIDAFSGLADTVSKVDVAQLAEALGALSDTFQDTPPQVRSSLDGLSRLSRTVADRDEQLRLLLKRTQGVTRVLAERREEFRALVADGNLLLDEVSRRRDAIHNLLVGTDDLARQLSGLARDNRRQLGPALRELRGVVEILRRNKANLELTLRRFAPFIKAFTNVVGNGRWFDNYIEGLIQPYQPGSPPVRVKGGDRPDSLWRTGR
jgi:phospholipid/cholesterol/gamma-HCH transport system substrate-binding protein